MISPSFPHQSYEEKNLSLNSAYIVEEEMI